MARRLKNTTVTLDEETARWARIEAAKRETSVSRLIGSLLRERMARDEEYELAPARYFARKPTTLRRPGRGLPTRDELHERDSLR